ncbi:hypothetical protein AB0O57_29225 [Streptomyces sp. NPDC091201]|uniref:hypothetical protein n=1 Tax=Streptomyces sp. NPDC091201 TaxID=3155190 RepID=UPI00343AE29E
MTGYRVVLRFEKDGPAVTGWWDTLAAAERTYTGWIGLYGSRPAAVITLYEVRDGADRVLKQWPRAADRP